jgi:hypothetical protein
MPPLYKATKRENIPVLERLGVLPREPVSLLYAIVAAETGFFFYDELRRDLCQLMFLHETIPFLFTQDVDQEIIDGISYTFSDVLDSLTTLEENLKQFIRPPIQEHALKK